MSLGEDAGQKVRFTAALRLWPSANGGGWNYVIVAGSAAEAIRSHEWIGRLEFGRRRGFGSVKVQVTVGESRWSTSVFPQKDGGWFLPVKRAICRAEELQPGEEIEFRLDLVEGRKS